VCKRDLHICEKWIIHTSKEAYTYVKRNLNIFQTTRKRVLLKILIWVCKRNLHIRKKDPLTRQKRPAKMSKGTFVYVREQLLLQEVFTCVCKRDLRICKRDLHTRQKRPTNISKGTNVCVKQQLLKVLMYVYTRNICVHKKSMCLSNSAEASAAGSLHMCVQKRPTYTQKRPTYTSKENYKKCQKKPMFTSNSNSWKS